jgi:hypothetical protein
VKRFGSIFGLAVPVESLSRLQAPDRAHGDRPYRVRIKRGACDAFMRLFRDAGRKNDIPIWVNHAPCAVADVSAIRETDAGWHFTADVEDGPVGRMLPSICRQRGCPIDSAGVTAEIPCSVGIVGDTLRREENGELVVEFHEITAVSEISILSGQRRGLFELATVRFKLEQTPHDELNLLRNWMLARPEDAALMPPDHW